MKHQSKYQNRENGSIYAKDVKLTITKNGKQKGNIYIIMILQHIKKKKS